MLRLYANDNKEWIDRVEWVKKSHMKMQVEPKGVKAFCSAVRVTINVDLKLSQEIKERLIFIVGQLEKFMISKEAKEVVCTVI